MKENPFVRMMLSSIGVAVLGAGSIYSVGAVYSYQVLKSASGGFGYLLSALGLGLTLGSIFSGFLGRHVVKERLFSDSILIFGLALVLFATIARFEFALFFSFIAGIALASVTVAAYTILQEKLLDEIRGRIFAALESLLRVSLFISLGVTAAFADVIGQARSISMGNFVFQLNGAQVTLFFGGIVVIAASLYSFRYVKSNWGTNLGEI